MLCMAQGVLKQNSPSPSTSFFSSFCSYSLMEIEAVLFLVEVSLCCNKKLAINYCKSVLQSCGNPFYPLCFKWLYLLFLVFRSIKLYYICCKPSYFALRFIAPSADISYS